MAESKEPKPPRNSPWLTGQFLVAMPSMLDPRFEKSIVFICSHGPEGAMGLVVNRLFGELNFKGLLAQFDIQPDLGVADRLVHYGGPVDPVRGFVLHTSDYQKEGTTLITQRLCLTATVEILEDLAKGCGPESSILLLGYAGWAPGQLESELQGNGWLTVPADEALLFDGDMDSKWKRALEKIGVSPTMLSTDVGHA
ncbi:MAG: YqgE/AlgH family protein [Proteobacteria bacterium]|nr:YqgE/AlgH family protein [Pseudomonadota bacterium]